MRLTAWWRRGGVGGLDAFAALAPVRERCWGAGVFAAGAQIFAARNFTLSREGQVTATRRRSSNLSRLCYLLRLKPRGGFATGGSCRRVGCG